MIKNIKNIFTQVPSHQSSPVKSLFPGLHTADTTVRQWNHKFIIKVLGLTISRLRRGVYGTWLCRNVVSKFSVVSPLFTTPFTGQLSVYVCVCVQVWVYTALTHSLSQGLSEDDAKVFCPDIHSTKMHKFRKKKFLNDFIVMCTDFCWIIVPPFVCTFLLQFFFYNHNMKQILCS